MRVCVRKRDSECMRERERERKRKKEMGECEEGRAERRKERKRMEEIGLCVYVCEREAGTVSSDNSNSRRRMSLAPPPLPLAVINKSWCFLLLSLLLKDEVPETSQTSHQD